MRFAKSIFPEKKLYLRGDPSREDPGHKRMGEGERERERANLREGCEIYLGAMCAKLRAQFGVWEFDSNESVFTVRLNKSRFIYVILHIRLLNYPTVLTLYYTFRII